MAVTIEDIKKLRHLTSAGLTDCKNALNEANGDMQVAVEILRKKGQAVAAKREDREASEGCVLSKHEGDFAAVVALKCETDFVAKNAGFVELTNKILDAAVANRVQNIEDLKALAIDGRTIADLIIEETGKTGEKCELGAYECITAPSVTSYNHFGNKLATIVGFNVAGADATVLRDVAMQAAAMNPVAATIEQVPEDIRKQELEIGREKAREEGKPEAILDRIAEGRLNKFYKESVLIEQEFVKDPSLTVGKYLAKSQAGLTVVDFKRVNLNED
ncbi:MAG: translation elongation factor Ts [Bacteroidales bacterium]|nr:translation elongation factor Ts [Bacteroidales bacterium]